LVIITVKFLMTGKDTLNATVPLKLCPALTANTPSDEGMKILAALAESLFLSYPASTKNNTAPGIRPAFHVPLGPGYPLCQPFGLPSSMHPAI
jgi:hypothetical protein